MLTITGQIPKRCLSGPPQGRKRLLNNIPPTYQAQLKGVYGPWHMLDCAKLTLCQVPRVPNPLASQGLALPLNRPNQNGEVGVFLRVCLGPFLGNSFIAGKPKENHASQGPTILRDAYEPLTKDAATKDIGKILPYFITLCATCCESAKFSHMDHRQENFNMNLLSNFAVFGGHQI